MDRKINGTEGRKTSLELEENVEAALAYVLGFLTGIILLLLEKESDFVRFHAMQSTITFLALTVVDRILGVVPLLGTVLRPLLSLVCIIAWIIGIIKAYQGEYYKFPIVGDIAEKQVRKINL